jgi:hypothetical protein
MQAIDLKQLLTSMDSYIKLSAQEVSELFSKRQVKFTVFDEKAVLELTPAMCEAIYRELITDMIKNKSAFASRYGLVTTIMPSEKVTDGPQYVRIVLGVLFTNN